MVNKFRDDTALQPFVIELSGISLILHVFFYLSTFHDFEKISFMIFELRLIFFGKSFALMQLSEDFKSFS